MKRFSILFLLLPVAYLSTAQILDPVDWNWTVRELGNSEFELVFSAEIEEGWNIYSQFVEEGGPIPTAFYFDDNTNVELVEKAVESGKAKEGIDPTFGIHVKKFFSGEPAVFRQRVRLLGESASLSGFLEYMACDAERCLPPTEVEFKFALGEASLVQEALSDLLSEETPTSGIIQPASWSTTVSPAENKDKVFTLKWTARLEEGWSLYSQEVEDGGPIPTTFHFDDSSSFQLLGPIEETGHIVHKEDLVFGIPVTKFLSDQPAVFEARIQVNDPSQSITGYVEAQVCDDSKCLFSNIDFKFVPGEGLALLGAEALPDENNETTPVISPEATGDLFAIPKPHLTSLNGDCQEEASLVEANTSYWNIFLLGFLGGLLALLTPCVFPMIPLTVSFFTKGGKSRAAGFRQAILYGAFIALVYLLLSIPFHLMDSINSDILNSISTNVWLNLFFFAVFVFFAFSFFGYYELTLPSSWANKASSAEGVGGVVGIFFMALTLAIISFSCTGPILGSLLVGSLTSSGGAWQLTAGMGGFGLALALPFGLFAAFPSMMQSLPKSGGWLNTVKVVLGFLELALALKFLSNADLVKHWNFLKIEPFLGLWILIFLGMALYLFGLIKFPHDSPVKKLGFGRIALGSLSLAFVLYLASGFLKNPDTGSYRSLKLLSGLAPPVCYSYFNPCNCPQGLECFKDLEAGLAYAQKENKPVMIDFTGYACVNCRKMEEHVWSEEPVKKLLKDEYVLISLYVDDKELLPEQDQVRVIRSNGAPRTLRTVGNKWNHFQEIYFKVNSQPYYVLMNPEGTELLNNPADYTPDVKEYAEFLRCGLDAYEQLQQQSLQ